MLFPPTVLVAKHSRCLILISQFCLLKKKKKMSLHLPATLGWLDDSCKELTADRESLPKHEQKPKTQTQSYRKVSNQCELLLQMRQSAAASLKLICRWIESRLSRDDKGEVAQQLRNMLQEVLLDGGHSGRIPDILQEEGQTSSQGNYF